MGVLVLETSKHIEAEQSYVLNYADIMIGLQL